MAEGRLVNQPIGTFLFRESESRPGFSLSLRVQGKVKHFMVQQKSECVYALVGKPREFSSMQELVEFHGTTPTSSAVRACAGTGWLCCVGCGVVLLY